MTVNFDGNSKVYDTRHGARAQQNLLADLASLANLKAAQTLLDFAAGTGRVSIGFAQLGLQVTAADVSRDMLAKLRDKAGDLSIKTDFLETATLPYADSHFDAVSAARVFYLIKDWQQSLSEITRVLKPNGIFFHEWANGTPSEPWVQVREQLREKLTAREYSNAFHPGARAEGEIDSYLSTLGFTEIGEASGDRPEPTTLRIFIGRIAARETSYLWEVPETTSSPVIKELWDWAEGTFDLDAPLSIPGKPCWKVYRLDKT